MISERGCSFRNKGSYMSAPLLLNLLNELGKTIRCEAASYRFSPTSLNKTGARMQDSIYHMTLKSHLRSDFRTKMSRFCH